MKQVLTDFRGDVSVGMYGLITDHYGIFSPLLQEKNLEQMKEIFKVDIIQTRITNVDIPGIFIAGNKNGIIIPNNITEKETKKIEKMGLNVMKLDSEFTAIGNLVLCNDNGAIISENIEDRKDEIEDCLGVPVEVGSVAGLSIVGSCAVATNEGCLAHPNTTEEEAQHIENILGVKVDIGTVNFGSPFVRSGILANKNALVLGKVTSGPEITRIAETLYE